MRRNLLAVTVALAALAFAGLAGATVAGTPGVSSTKITIGSSGPLSGEAAAAAGVLRGADAYFKYVNGRGGVYGRSIDFKYLDDAYDPSQTVQNVRQLIQQDNVFALFSVVGTNGNLAVRDFTNASGVPQVFSAAGATTLGRDYAKYPWTIGYLPPYSEEGKIYARHILATNAKKAKIAVLYQSDDYGKDLLERLPQRARREPQADRADRRLRPDDVGRLVAGRAAESERSEHVRDLRVRQVRDPGVRLREQARLEAADLRQRRRFRFVDHEARPAGHRRGLDLGALGEGSRDAEVREGSGRRAGGRRSSRSTCRVAIRPTGSSSPGWRRRSRSSTRSSRRART